ncbi:MAG: transglutaminase domain-containing protein [Clostridia bacterium]|nr:transglutaminase domain-containing protein [Clostridia bacterium]
MKKLMAITIVAMMATTNIITLTTAEAAEVVLTAAIESTTFNETVISNIKAKKTSIDISKYKLSPEKALSNYFTLKNCEPDIWYSSSTASVTKKNGKAYTLNLNYTYTEKEILVMQAYIDKIVNDIVAVANTFQTDYDKAKAVYDFLIDNYNYDWSLTKTTEYELFKTGEGVCSAYSLAFKDIMQELNIPCEIVVSKEMAHQWNVIMIDGEWYNVDVAWGDMYGDNYKLSCFAKSDFFFEMLGHTGGISENGVKCNSKNYDLRVN